MSTKDLNGVDLDDGPNQAGHIDRRRTYRLDDRYTTNGPVYLTGIQALVRMLVDRSQHDIEQGRTPATFVSGYEGSPLAGYDLEIARRIDLLTPYHIVFRPGLNEELAATSVSGTQIADEVATLRTIDGSAPAGVTGVWYGKAAGLDRASDALRHANLIGTSPHGGVVALVGDDPAMKSSSCPTSSEPAIADLQMPAFYPADAQEILDYYQHAVEISRASGLWAAMKIAVNAADGGATVTPPSEWVPPNMADLPGGLRAYSHRPHARLLGSDQKALEHSLQHDRQDIAMEYVRRSGVNTIKGSGEGATIGIVAAGKTWLDVRQALTALGLGSDLERHGIRLLKFGAIYPVEPTVVQNFATGLTEIIVVEDKRPYLEQAIRSILYGSTDAPPVHGRYDGDGRRLFSAAGELDPDSIAVGLARQLTAHGTFPTVQAWSAQRKRERIMLPLAPRTPYFCSGCPHNSSTKVPDGTLVGGGIGCHSMVMMLPEEQRGDVTGLCQMGGEGAQWIGIAPFVETPHLIQNIGDGTFAHSGSLAVRAAAAAGVNITYKVLYNSTVAMTGGQDAVGSLSLEQITSMLLLEGARKVVVTTEQPARIRRRLRAQARHIGAGRIEVRHRDELVAVQEELAQIEGLTVLVHDQECAAEKRRKRKRKQRSTPAERVFINERVCEGCGDCGQKSNCLSVRPTDTEFGRKTQIHQSSCNFDFSCLNGDCPSFLTVVPGGKRPRGAAPVAAELPDPVPLFDAESFAMRITGIGGTGVVTVGQILATAAFLDGRHVRTLDQTGLAQKGGAVVSDLKFSSKPEERAAKLADLECDLYLACDSLVAVDPTHLRTADPHRTVAVVSTSEVPTGAMVVRTQEEFPAPEEIRGALGQGVGKAHYLDAGQLADDLFGDEQYANMITVGAAYQAGALPINAESLERAIQLNGAAVETNLAAFRQGRHTVQAQNEAEKATPQPRHSATADRVRQRIDATGELGRLLDIRVPELVDYQDARYADDYVDFLATVLNAEQAAVPGSTALAEAVARNLYKLMAYKDEYEVARLCLDPAITAEIERTFGPGSRASVRLHPPVLRALGMQRKISVGRWGRPAFRLLYSMRRLRGTAFDPFGHARVRRTERALVSEYRASLSTVLQRLDSGILSLALEIAELPDMIRGYEDIKLSNVEQYRQRLDELMTKLG